MEFYTVPVLGRAEGKIAKTFVPGSKSITNRALLLAALAKGESCLSGIQFSDDSRHFMQCVEKLGIQARISEPERTAVIQGCGGRIPKREEELYVGSAGTAARFLTATLGISSGSYRMDASEQMKKRPMAPLIASLRTMGAEIDCTEKENFFPFAIKGSGKAPAELTVNIDDSSQFLSALLIACAADGEAHRIHVEGTHGMAYIDMTVEMLRQFGVTCEKDGNDYVLSGELPQGKVYAVEPDVSGACYFYALAAITGASVRVCGVHREGLQGDLAFLDVLEEMGCKVEDECDGICVTGPSELQGGCFDLSSFSDQALTLAAIAPFAKSSVTIQGIGHIRLQECDRIIAMQTNLRALGVPTRAYEDAITIYPEQVHGGTIRTFDDHRVAMAFSLPGLIVPGVQIENPGCVRKTFENYYEVLADVCAALRS